MHSSRVHKSRSITGSEALPGLVPLGRIGDLAGEAVHFGEQLVPLGYCTNKAHKSTILLCILLTTKQRCPPQKSQSSDRL